MMRKILILACLSALTSCTAPGIELPEPAQVLNIALVGTVESLDPASPNPPPTYFLAQVFEGLTKINEMNKPEPGLAKSWDIEDGRIKFHIDDRKFSDGTVVTSAHVADSLEMLAKTDSSWVVKNITGFSLYSQGRSASIEGIDIVDEKTVAIKTNDAPEHFLLKLASPFASVWKKSDQFPIGTGVFAIKKFVPEVKVILEPNGFCPQKTKLKQVNFVIRNTYETAFEDFRQGRLHAARISDDLVPRANDEAGCSVVTLAENALVGMGFNCKSPKFAISSNRHAVIAAIDASKLNEDAFQKRHVPVRWPQKKGRADFNELTITVPGMFGERFGESIKGQIEQNIGVKVKIATLDQDGYIKALESGKVECFVFGLTLNTPDPYEILSFPISSEIFRNTLGFDFTEYSKVLKASASLGDRDEKLQEARAMLESNAPFFEILGLNSFGCVWDSVDGFTPEMFSSDSFANVSIRR